MDAGNKATSEIEAELRMDFLQANCSVSDRSEAHLFDIQ